MTAKELKLWAQQRSQWLLVFVTPLIFIAIQGSVFGQGGTTTVAVYLVDEDQGREASQIINALEDEKTLNVEKLATRAEADRRVGNGERMAAVVVPAGFGAALRTDAGAQIEVIVDPAREQAAGIVLGQVQAATAPMLVDAEVTRGMHKAFNTAPDLLGIDTAAAQSNGLDLPAIEKFLAAAIKGVVASQVQDAIDAPLVNVVQAPADPNVVIVRRPTIFDYLVPGYATFFAFFLLQMMAETLLNERVSGTLRRLFTLPLSRAAFLIGKALPYFIVAAAQIVLVMGVSSVLFSYSLGHSPLALALLTGSFAAVIAGLGVMLAVLVRSEGQADAVPTLVALGTAAVSGAIFPTIRIPGLELLTPQYWAINGFLQVTATGAGVQAVLLNIGVLLAMAAIYFAVAVWRFRF